jgi:hypothetical protein
MPHRTAKMLDLQRPARSSNHSCAQRTDRFYCLTHTVNNKSNKPPPIVATATTVTPTRLAQQIRGLRDSPWRLKYQMRLTRASWTATHRQTEKQALMGSAL